MGPQRLRVAEVSQESQQVQTQNQLLRKKTMKKPTRFIVALVAVIACTTMLSSASAQTVQETYLGKLEFQGQTITKETAELLHRRILQQRATQLVTWAMPMMNFNTLYPAMLSNQKMSENDVFFSLCDGYDGVYPYMTANVTTPYTIAMSDLSKTGPVILDLPAGEIYGVVNDAWMQPIKEIGSGKPETLLLLGPGQKAPEDFKGEIVQSNTFLVLYFYRALGTGDEAKKLRTAVQAYKLSEAKNPPKTKFIKYDPKPGDKVELNTQPRDMRFWELVNELRTTGADGGSRPLLLRLAEGSRHRKRQTLQADCSAERDSAARPGRWHGHVASDLLQQNQGDVPDITLWQGFRF